MFEEHQDSTSLCVGCPKMCRHACPVSNATARETLTPGMKMSAVDLVRRNALPLAPDVVEAIHSCTGCGGCEEFCLLGNRVVDSLVGARADAARAGVAPLARTVARRLQETGNPAGVDRVTLQDKRLPPRPERGALVYWAGCTSLAALEEHDREAHQALEVATGGTVAVVPPSSSASCCGYPLWAAGLLDEFLEQARRTSAHVAERGTLVTSDPGCAWTMRELWPRVGVPGADVRHVSQVLAGSPLPTHPGRERSLWHDPCHLARHLDVTAAPREVLLHVEGRAPAEFTWSGRNTECCGGGALFPEVDPTAAARMAERRVRHEVDELARTGATRVVTSCPTCEVQLRGAGVPVVDLCRVVVRG